MVTKGKDSKASEQTKLRAKVGKLRLNKEAIKDLTPDQLKQLKGGQVVRQPNDSVMISCSCHACS